MTYNRTLDGLRGVAILLVLLFHFRFILEVGWIGVQLFFVLSGYLITSILVSGKETSLDYYLKRFYWRRTLRIFPLYFGYLFLALAAFLLKGIPGELPEMFPYLATYTFNFYPLAEHYSFQDYFFTHFWSLSVEEQFYLFWPFVVYFCTRRQLQWVLIAVICASPIIRLVLADSLLAGGYDSHYAGEIVYRFTLSQLDGFAFGALIPVFGIHKKQVNLKSVLPLAALFVAALGVLNFYFLRNSGQPLSWTTLGFPIGGLANYQHVWSYTVFNLLFFTAILYIVNPATKKGVLTRWALDNQIMVYFGKISYGLYVYHWIIWMAFGKFASDYLANNLLAFLIYTVICMAVASASYYCFERPILLFKDKYFKSNKTLTNEQVRTSF